MHEPELFLGFLIDAFFSKELEALSPKKRELFIKKFDPSYLQIVKYHNNSYLGKFIGKICRAEDLSLLELNIRSLVLKLAPPSLIADLPLLLFSIFNEQEKNKDST